MLTWVPGDAPVPPYPSWAMTDDALVSCARLLRRYHDAVASFDPASVSGWELDWADPTGGSIVCHNDVFPENVVFRDGRAVAFIDFDMAGPGRHFWDLAVATQEWLPLHAPSTRRDHPAGLDAVARFGHFARAYGVTADDAVALVDVVFEERTQAMGNIRQEAERGTPVWVSYWFDDGGEERARRDEEWLATQRDALIAAI